MKTNLIAQQQRLEKLAITQKQNDARLGSEQQKSSPRGQSRRLKHLCNRMRATFPDGLRTVRARSWVLTLLLTLWRMILRVVLGPLARGEEPDPKGWPPSWPILLPRSGDLRRVWKRRFGTVTLEAEALNQAANERHADTEHYKSEAGRKQERLDSARRLAPAPAASPESLFSRVLEFLRTWRLDALFPSMRPVPPVVTLDEVLKDAVRKPISEADVQQRFHALMLQCQSLLARIEKAEQDIPAGAH